jgi:hypothetical protein
MNFYKYSIVALVLALSGTALSMEREDAIPDVNEINEIVASIQGNGNDNPVTNHSESPRHTISQILGNESLSMNLEPMLNQDTIISDEESSSDVENDENNEYPEDLRPARQASQIQRLNARQKNSRPFRPANVDIERVAKKMKYMR